MTDAGARDEVPVQAAEPAAPSAPEPASESRMPVAPGPGRRRGFRRSYSRAARGRRARRAAGGDRDGDVPLPRDPLRRASRALGRPARVRMVHPGGHPSGGGGDGGDPRLPGIARDLLRPLPDHPGGTPPGARLPQHLLLDAGSGRPAARLQRGRRRRCPPGRSRRRQLGGRGGLRSGLSSAWGRATSPRWPRSTIATTGPWTSATRRPRWSSFALAPRSCRTRRSPIAPRPAARSPSPTRRRGCSSRASTSPGLASIDTYRRLGGYRSLERAFRDLEPEELLGVLEESGLRGRGGAGFSMGKKASFLPRGEMSKYLCCNADESEPGAFKDRELMQKNPHQLIEGIAIAALAAGAGWGFVFIRGEYAAVADILDRAVAEAYEAGYLGENILGSGHRVEVVVHRGAGAYICGEETALLDALEGKRGNPRLKPPFPAIQGLYGGPTLINNVETLSNVPHIVANGAEWFKGLGTEQSPGTKVVSVSGCVQRPGNYEVAARDPRPGADLRAGRRPARRTRGQGLVPGRLLGAGPDRGRARPPLQLRGDGRSGLDARLGVDHRRRRLDLDPGAGAAHGALLPPRVVRKVHAVSRRHQLDGEDAREGDLRRGDPDGPRHHRLGAGEHHRPLPVRARRLDGDAGSAAWWPSSAPSSKNTSDESQATRRVRAPTGRQVCTRLPGLRP